MRPNFLFVLVEGVNVVDNIYDTDQLSIIRGTSTLYRRAIVFIKQHFESAEAQTIGTLEAVSTGASSGLFHVTQGDIKAIESEIKSLLKQDSYFKHLSFQVTSCEAESLSQARNQLDAQLRIQQLQGFTVQPDQSDEGRDQFGKAVCELEGRRIDSSNLTSVVQSDTQRKLATSVHDRLTYGRKQRQGFYEEALEGQSVLPRLIDCVDKRSNNDTRPLFANHFVELCSDSEKRYGNLADKMAVVYIDGNEFGERQRVFIEQQKQQGKSDIQAQQVFDQTIQTRRASFLASEIDRELELVSDEGVIPLETLMWGGDEMLLVMPAWAGFDFLQRFFNYDWKLINEPLTHAAGMVFCQASTPIRVIQNLAKELAEQVKEESDRMVDGWDYLVLESVDYPASNDLSVYFQARYGKSLEKLRKGPLGFLPRTTDWVRHRKIIEQVKINGQLSKRQLYNIVNQTLKTVPEKFDALSRQGVALSWPVSGFDKEQSEEQGVYAQLYAEQRLYEVSSDKEWLSEELPVLATSLFGIDIHDPKQRAWLWVHLVELWDYLAPESLKKVPSDSRNEAAA